MQWTDARNGGFSSARPEDLYLPVIEEGDHSYHRVNVGAQEGDADSQLSWTIRLAGVRRRLGFTMSTSWRLAESGNDAVLAICHCDRDDFVMTLHNFSSGSQSLGPELFADMASLHPVFGDRQYDLEQAREGGLTLEPFGYLWLSGSRG